MNEFQLTLTNVLRKRAMSVSDLAKQAGYAPFLLENIVTGKSRRIPVDFFVRLGNVLDLAEAEKEALIRSWAFGVDKWNWSHGREYLSEGQAQRRTG